MIKTFKYCTGINNSTVFKQDGMSEYQGLISTGRRLVYREREDPDAPAEAERPLPGAADAIMRRCDRGSRRGRAARMQWPRPEHSMFT